MQEFFGPGGVLEQRLDDYEFRPSQVRMAEAVRRALEEQNHVIIEAGAGAGKKPPFFLAGVLSWGRVFVLTGPENLQGPNFLKKISLFSKGFGGALWVAHLQGT